MGVNEELSNGRTRGAVGSIVRLRKKPKMRIVSDRMAHLEAIIVFAVFRCYATPPN